MQRVYSPLQALSNVPGLSTILPLFHLESQHLTDEFQFKRRQFSSHLVTPLPVRDNQGEQAAQDMEGDLPESSFGLRQRKSKGFQGSLVRVVQENIFRAIQPPLKELQKFFSSTGLFGQEILNL